MFKLRYAFFKLAVVSAVLDGGLRPSFAENALPRYEIVIQAESGSPLRVGDRVPYRIAGGEGDWRVSDPRPASEKGYLFLEGGFLVPLIPAEIQLPALPIVDGKGNPVAETDPTVISVGSNLEGLSPEEASQPADALGPLSLPFPDILKVVTLSLVALVFAFIAYLTVRFLRSRARNALDRFRAKKPYDLAAIDRLDAAMKNRDLHAKGHQPLYFLVSEVLKSYLSDRFDMDARESTSEELFTSLRERTGNTGLDENAVSRIETLFREMDWVKFADRKADEEEASKVVKEAKEIILITRRRDPDPILSPNTSKGGLR